MLPLDTPKKRRGRPQAAKSTSPLASSQRGWLTMPTLNPREASRGPDSGTPEGGVIDVRVSVDQDDVQLLPAAPLGVVERHRQVRVRPRPRRHLPLPARADLDDGRHSLLITAGPM